MNSKYIKNIINMFILPIYFMAMILCNSSYGQHFLNSLGFSFLICIYFFIQTLIKYKYLNKPIKIVILVFLLYTFLCVFFSFSNDYYYWFIAIFTVMSFLTLLNVKISESQFKINIILYSSISLIMLILFTSGIAFTRWNPNNISLLSTFGLMGCVILFNYCNKLRHKAGMMVVLLYFTNKSLLTDSRNGILVTAILFLTVIILYKIVLQKMWFRVYYLLSIFMALIIPNIINVLNNSTYITSILMFSKKYFEKDSLLSSRDYVWNMCITYIGDKWVFGHGESLYNYLYSHNMYYSVVYMFGIVGYIIFIILNVVVFETIYKYAKNDKISMVCLLSYIAHFWQQIAENNLFTSDMSFYFPYVLLSVALSRALLIKKISIKM